MSEPFVKIDVGEIIAEWNWNSRKGITDESVAPLAESIRTNGLEQPIVVRRLADGYGVVTGFRRFKAIADVLGQPQINCYIREYTEHEAKLANFRENGEREQISFWEECLFVRDTFDAECQMIQLQTELNKNYDWVRPRRQIWTLPQVLIDLTEQGVYSARNIGELLKRDPEQQAEAAKQAEAASGRGEEGKEVRKRTMTRRHVQGRKNVSRMMSIIEQNKLTQDPAVHQILLWAMGDLTKAELATRLNVDLKLFLAVED